MAEGRRVFTDATQNSQSGCKKLGKHGSRKRAVRRVRYLDPRTSRWLSADPALGEYMTGSSVGEGGIYNQVNFNLYHYAGNNPVKYIDPTGKADKKNQFTVEEVYFFGYGTIDTNLNGYSFNFQEIVYGDSLQYQRKFKM